MAMVPETHDSRPDRPDLNMTAATNPYEAGLSLI